MARWILVACVCACALPARAQAPALDPPPQSPPVETLQAPAAARESKATGAKVWIGREVEIAEYLRSAAIDRIEDIPIGVTKPRRAFFVPGGPAGSAAVKALPTARRGGFWESYKSEIAAYELDRVLGLDMVPVTVERRVGHDLASVQLWVEGCRLLKGLDQSACTRPVEFAKQVCRQRVFDDLIGNIDRNAGNLLVDGEWNLILIDHSRAFTVDSMPNQKKLTRIDRELFAALKALDEPTLMKRIRPLLLGDKQVRELLRRRDRIVAHFEQQARERGEQAVFPF